MTHAETRRATPASAATSNILLTERNNSEAPTPNQGSVACQYAVAGTPVFPCDPATKRPLTEHGFHDASTDPAIVKAWWLQWPSAMIGCPTGAASGWWVLDVDVDPEKGIDGRESLARLVATCGALPSTRIHRTPRGGEHHVFASFGPPVKCSAGAVAPGLDVRGDGGYVILPGSRREDGAEYTVVRDSAPVHAPQWLLDLTGSKPSRPLPSDGPIPEGGRNSELTRQGGALRKVGMSAEHILDALRAINATRCNPPLDDEEVIQIARSVARYAPDAPIYDGFGDSDPSALACLVPPPPVAPRFQLLTSRQVDAMPAMRDLVKGILPAEGIAAIFGPSASGKSFLLLDLLASIATGRDWFGHRVYGTAPVVYVGLEGQGGIRKRKLALEAKFGPLPDYFHFVLSGGLDLRNATDRAGLIAAVKATGGEGAIICIDTLNAAAPGADENSSQDMGAIIGGAKMIQAALGGLVILVHHTGKDTSKGLRGHSSLLAALDAAIAVERDNSGRRWKIAKAKDDEDGDEHAFILSPKIIGEDEDGATVSSCFVSSDIAPSPPRPKGPQGGHQRAIYDCLQEMLKNSPHIGQGGAPAGTPCVALSDLLDELKGRLAVEPERLWERARTAITGLTNRQCVVMRENWLWLP